MKKTKLFATIALVLGVTFIFSACKKDGDDPVVVPTFTGSWELTHDKTEYLDSVGAVIDVEDSTYVHGKSEIAVFNSDSTFTVRDYSGPTDTLVTSGTYLLLPNNKLVLNNAGQPSDTSNYTLSATTLVLIAQHEIWGIAFKTTVTFTRQ